MPSTRQKTDLIWRWIGRWKPRLLLDKWAVIPKLDDHDPVRKDGVVDMAGSVVDQTNSECWLSVYPRLWKESKEYQEMTIIHEMAHIHTDPVRDLLMKSVKDGTLDKKDVTDKVEDLTNSIAKIVYLAYRRTKRKEYHL